MKFPLLVLFSFILANQSIAADYYNKNAGFGFWYPSSWETEENGRSATTTGGEFDREKSEILIGSDWISSVKDIDTLKIYLQKNYSSNSIIEKITFAFIQEVMIV